MFNLREYRNHNPSEFGENSSPGSSPRFPLVPYNDLSDESRPPTPDGDSRPVTPEEDVFVSARPSPEPPSRPPTPVISRLLSLSTPQHHIDRQILRLEGLIRNFHDHLDIPYEDTPVQFLPSPFNLDLTQTAANLEHQLDHLTLLYQQVEARRNRPLSPLTEPSTSASLQVLEDYRIYRYRGLAAINARWAVIFAWRPAYFGLTLVRIGAALQLSAHFPNVSEDQTVPIHQIEFLRNVRDRIPSRITALDPRARLYPPITELTFIPPNDPFAQAHPLSLRVSYLHLADNNHPLVTYACLELRRDGELLTTFSYNGRQNGEHFQALPDEIKLALCIYVIDPRIWHIYRRTQELHFFPPFLGLEFA